MLNHLGNYVWGRLKEERIIDPDGQTNCPFGSNKYTSLEKGTEFSFMDLIFPPVGGHSIPRSAETATLLCGLLYFGFDHRTYFVMGLDPLSWGLSRLTWNVSIALPRAWLVPWPFHQDPELLWVHCGLTEPSIFSGHTWHDEFTAYKVVLTWKGYFILFAEASITSQVPRFIGNIAINANYVLKRPEY